MALPNGTSLYMHCFCLVRNFFFPTQNHDQYIARYLKTGEKRVMGKKRELMARHKSGKEFPIELGLTEILHRGGKVTFTGVVRDLSDQKHDKVELRLKHSLTLSIIEAAFDAMFYINERGIIQMVNEAAVKQFGWSRSEFLGSNISMICGGGEFHIVAELIFVAASFPLASFLIY